jgi:hypothetical protein
VTGTDQIKKWTIKENKKMWYGMVYFPDLQHEGLNNFRKKYDPTSNLIREHLPVMMPVPASMDFKSLIHHIRTILEPWEPFRVHFRGLSKSWDHWLLLEIEEGRDRVEKLHHEIYSGMLKSLLRADIPYHPHLGLGHFTSDEYDPLDPREVRLDEEKYLIALKEAENLDLDFWCLIDSFDLVQLNDSYSRLIIKENFKLTKKK